MGTKTHPSHKENRLKMKKEYECYDEKDMMVGSLITQNHQTLQAEDNNMDEDSAHKPLSQAVRLYTGLNQQSLNSLKGCYHITSRRHPIIQQLLRITRDGPSKPLASTSVDNTSQGFHLAEHNASMQAMTVKTLLEARKPSLTETSPENHGTIVAHPTATE
ncbi:unnamed protein product [Mytilus edulis]|uniref:Uncharacterized protein n=1 Tax=Mytilus edulis TaxID=6550 RepID=A0A8S3R820_MYTED|nr:unnamed protein product [Mytilus edulis]